MTLLKKLLLLILIPLMAFGLHKYYISLTQIDYKAQEKSLQISMHLFTDDVEKTLTSNFKKDFKLDTPDELANTNKLLEFYINSHFKVHVNGKLLAIKFLGKEYDQDLVYFYIEIKDVASIKSIEIENTILMDEFEEQQNIIKLNIDKILKTMILVRDNDKDLLNF